MVRRSVIVFVRHAPVVRSRIRLVTYLTYSCLMSNLFLPAHCSQHLGRAATLGLRACSHFLSKDEPGCRRGFFASLHGPASLRGDNMRILEAGYSATFALAINPCDQREPGNWRKAADSFAHRSNTALRALRGADRHLSQSPFAAERSCLHDTASGAL